MLTSLRKLSVRKNALTALPDSVCNLVNLRVLLVDKNQNLETLPANFGELCVTFKRLSARDTPLAEKLGLENGVWRGCFFALNFLKSWEKLAGKKASLNMITLTQDELYAIEGWIRRLEGYEYLSCHVIDILNDIDTFPEFKGIFLTHVKANNEACHVRALDGFSRIYTAWKMYTVEREGTTESKLRLFVRLATTNEFRDYLHSINITDVHKSLRHELSYKEVLDLETVVTNGEYTDPVNPSVVKKVKSKVFERLLNDPQLDALLEEDDGHQEDLAELQAAFYKKQEELDEANRKSEINDDQYLISSAEVMQELGAETKNLRKKWLINKLIDIDPKYKANLEKLQHASHEVQEELDEARSKKVIDMVQYKKYSTEVEQELEAETQALRKEWLAQKLKEFQIDLPLSD